MHHRFDLLLIQLEDLLVQDVDSLEDGLLLVFERLSAEVLLREGLGVLLDLDLVVLLEVFDALVDNVLELLRVVHDVERLLLVHEAEVLEQVLLDALSHDGHHGLAVLGGLIVDRLDGLALEAHDEGLVQSVHV